MKHKWEKMRQFIIKHDELFFVIIFFIIIFGITINIETVPTDEVWNFQNIYKMYNGYKIYIDANVITTPLFHIIGLILFKIFGANFFIFKIYGIFINLFLILGEYKILKSLNISKLNSLCLSFILFLAQITVYHNTTNYNALCLTFITYGVLIVLKRKNFSNNKFVFLESLIVFFILLTKQNIGIIYFISIVLYNLIFEIEKFGNIFKIGIINIFLLTIFIFIMDRLGILNGFISYAILGIGEFIARNFAITGPIIRLITISSVDLIFVIFFNYKKMLNAEENKNINIISLFSFLLLAVAYPIFNVYHIDVALFFMYILLVYIMYLIFYDFFSNKKNIYKIVMFFTVILTVISNIRCLIYFCKIDYSYPYNNIYFGSLISNEMKDKIEKVTDYINNSQEKVIVFSTEAALYMMPLKESNGRMDEPLLGNFGKNGEDGVIDEISKMENTKIMINKERNIYQESDKIIEYIKNNLTYVGKIEDLLIYQTKKYKINIKSIDKCF